MLCWGWVCGIGGGHLKDVLTDGGGPAGGSGDAVVVDQGQRRTFARLCSTHRWSTPRPTFARTYLEQRSE